MGKPTMCFLNRSDTNRPVQAQKRARSLKLILVEEELYRLVKTKALISFAVTAKLIYTLILFSPMQIVGFSHEVAHLLIDFENLKTFHLTSYLINWLVDLYTGMHVSM